MEEDLLAGAREWAEALEEAVAGGVWEETVRVQDPAETAFVRIAAREYRISRACRVIR